MLLAWDRKNLGPPQYSNSDIRDYRFGALVCTFWLVVYLQEVLFGESKCLYVLIINYQSSEVLSNIHVISQEARTIVISLKY